MNTRFNIIFLLCAMLVLQACAKRSVLLYSEKTVIKPASFIVKIEGEITHESEGKVIQVGEILNRQVSENLKKLDVLYNSSKNNTNKYILLVDIKEFRPGSPGKDFLARMVPFMGKKEYIPVIVAEATIYTTEQDNNGELVIDTKLASVPLANSRGEAVWDFAYTPESIIKKCSDNITTALNDAFLK